MKPLDDIDRALVAQLQDNARTPLAALARRVGLSRSAAQERLQRLERSGVIAQYTLRRGDAGRGAVQAWLWLRFAEGFSCEDVMPQLEPLPAVRLAHSVTGDIDLMVLVECESAAALSALREAVLAMKAVDDVTTSMVLKTQLDRR